MRPNAASPRTLQRSALTAGILAALLAGPASSQAPPPPGRLIDIGGQRVHLHCSGSGSPTVLLEAGAGDFSLIWAKVQPEVSRFTRVCSYDRAGFAWSDPGAVPRTYAQSALELRTALRVAREQPPFVVVGQSFGGLLVRGFTAVHRADVAGMVLVDAAHEDGSFGPPERRTRIRDGAQGRAAPPAHIAPDAALLALRRGGMTSRRAPEPLEPPLDLLPAGIQRLWQWAARDSVYRLAGDAEMAWSPEELQRMHDDRVRERRTLGDLPLIVLGRKLDAGDAERRAQQLDLGLLSSRAEVRFSTAGGHNLHVEDPAFVIQAIHDMVTRVRAQGAAR